MEQANIELKENERIDDLQRNGYRIIQNKDKFCFGMDAVLLSGFARVNPGDRVIDLGTGTGIIPILLEAKYDGEHYTGLEIQEEMAERAEKFQERAAALERLSYALDGLLIRPCASEAELRAEGRALHHCVGGYVDRVAKKECIILFLRQCEDVDKPFFTVEVRGGKVVQVRGMRNCDATPEVKTFMASGKGGYSVIKFYQMPPEPCNTPGNRL